MKWEDLVKKYVNVEGQNGKNEHPTEMVRERDVLRDGHSGRLPTKKEEYSIILFIYYIMLRY